MNTQDYYKKGFDSHVARTHEWRTPENCAQYLLPYIKPGDKLLDVGCGPGTITSGFTRYAKEVVGLDTLDEILDMARDNSKGIENLTFVKGEVAALPFEDNTFDVIHIHQVLVHLKDPISAIRECCRVLKHGGVLGAREGDIALWSGFPEKESEIIRDKFSLQTESHHNAGRLLYSWFIESEVCGEVISTTSTNIWFVKPEEKRAFGTSFVERVLMSTHDNIAGDTTEEKEANRNEIVKAIKTIIADKRGCFLIPNGEVVFQKD